MLLQADSFTKAEWDSLSFHMHNLIRTEEQLQAWVELTTDERAAIRATEGKYRWLITPYYAALMDKHNPRCPIRLQAIPNGREMENVPGTEVDPVGDMHNSKTRRIVHKYPNRVVFLVSDTCPVYCRHCTRKFHTTDLEGSYYNQAFAKSYEADFEYIRAHPEIDDVLLTGGDPLILPDHKLEAIISTLRSIPHINIIRLGTRYPVFLPQRVTAEFCAMLARYHPVWLNTHFNHPVEVTADAAAACDRLLRHGVPVQNQSVLLKGVNDDVETMRALVKGLLKIRVRPYYLYHCDNVTGVAHFMTTIDKGRQILDALVGFETGFSVPSYVLTTGLGKIPIQRDYLEQHEGRLVARNYQGRSQDVTLSAYGRATRDGTSADDTPRERIEGSWAPPMDTPALLGPR
jgi:lysine 2,3-aminomutase